MSLAEVQREIKKQSNAKKAKFLQRFFKTGRGGYAEGDLFLGLRVPQSRKIALKFQNLEFPEIKKLLQSKYHEERLIALVILNIQFQKGSEEKQKQIFSLYLKFTKHINNWDLVDLSAPNIVGNYLLNRPKEILYKLAKSKHLWERRIAIVATYSFIRQGVYLPTIKISEALMDDTHDLIHKAVGWMLREVGKKDEKVLINFLTKHYRKLPRTTLRYAIERLTVKQKIFFMKK